MRDSWQEYRINEFAEVISGGTPSSDQEEYWNGNIVWITPSDLSKLKFPIFDNSFRKISDKGLRNSSATLIPKNSIVISSRAPIGYVALAGVDFTTNQGCKSVVPKKHHDPLFHYYNFSFNKSKFINRGEGTTFSEISKKEIEKLSFYFPDRPYQRKIAKILNTVDAVIEKTEAAISKYKGLKQGMMQDLFTRGIDPQTGKLRPTQKDAPQLYKVDSISKGKLGKEFFPGDWEIKKLSDIIYLRHGYQFRDYDFVQEGIDVIKIGQIGRDGKVYLSNSSKISSRRSKEFEGISLINGDILMALTGATLGKTALVKGVNKPLVQNYRVGFFTPKNENEIYKPFLYYLLAGNYVQNEILGFVNTGAQGNIGKADFEKIKVAFPSDYSEQKRIADQLVKIDDLIEKEQTNLSKHQSLKKGLMQDLLTGKVEVEV